MWHSLLFTALAICMSSAPGQSLDFDQTPVGSLPTGWISGSTGGGNPKWSVEADPTAPSKPLVLRQSGSGTYPWAVIRDVRLEDGYVEVNFKPISGRRDQAGGVVWRWKDGDNYYVARANALENNVSLYHTTGGTRKTIKSVDAPVPTAVWHALRVEFSGTRIRVLLNGKICIELDDRNISGPGAVGVWSKADSVTAFDDFRWGQTGKNSP